VRIDPVTDKVAAVARVGPGPSAVAVGAGRVWVTTRADDSLWRIDPGTLRLLRIAANVNPVGVAVSGGTAFVANDISPSPPPVGSVTLIDATSGDTLAVIPTAGASAIANGAGVWLINAAAWPAAGELLRVGEPAAHAGLILQSIPIPDPSPDEENSGEPTGVAIGEGGVWVLGDALERTLWRIDPGAGRIEATIPLPFVPSSVVAGAGAVWVTAQLEDVVARIDPARKRIVATIRVGREPTGVAIGDGSVWVADTIDRTVTRIDPRSNRVVATIPVAASPAAIAVGEGSVWVAGDAS
jgi:YVTN family beta-propeller protein